MTATRLFCANCGATGETELLGEATGNCPACDHALQRVYRYDNVQCSQCGANLGPGDHGVSYCSAHGGPGKVDTAAMRKNEAERRAAERAAALQADTSGAHLQRKAAEDRAALAEQHRDALLVAADEIFKEVRLLSGTSAAHCGGVLKEIGKLRTTIVRLTGKEPAPMAKNLSPRLPQVMGDAGCGSTA